MKLAFGCHCSDIKVIPSTWSRENASTKKDWYVYFRFYDPLFKDQHPKGLLKIFKGMNHYKDRKERQDETRDIIKRLFNLLVNCNWNPITGRMDEEDKQIDYVIHPDTPLCKALEAAYDRIDVAQATRIDIKSVRKYFDIAAAQLRLDNLSISDVRRRHLLVVLDQIVKNRKLSAQAYNLYRKYLSMLFKELVQVEAIDANPMIAVVKKKEPPRASKIILTDEECEIIDQHLKATTYEFWRLMQIFSCSGSRTTETLAVKKEDVDIKNQIVKYTVNKGRAPRIEERPIALGVIHLWQEVYDLALPNQFIFSVGLVPGNKQIRTEQIKRRWHDKVNKSKDKGGLGIAATWYSLKHLYTDRLAALYDTSLPAFLNKHSQVMTEKHYAVNVTKRKNDILRYSIQPEIT